MRIGHRIYSLHTQTKDEVMYTYQRVFKYLMETLAPDEFEHLPFQSVNKLIDVIFKTKIQTNAQKRMTLRQFIYKALDLNYFKSD